MTKKEAHLKLSEIKIDNDNLDYIKSTGEICGKLRDDLVKLMSIPDKRYFYFDYLAYIKTNNDGHLRGTIDTERIHAYDIDHAILLFKVKHPDTPFDPPY